MVNVMLVLTVAVLGMMRCAASYEFAPSSGCMVLYKNEHAHGASWVQKSNGDWYTWTSAECRDWCASNADCLAVDFVGQEKTCLVHKQKFTRIPVTSASTGKTEPETVSQYAKECGNTGGYVAGPEKTRVLFLDLILTLDASSATGSSGFVKAQQFIIMLLQTYKLGGESLRLKVVYSRGASIQVFTFDRDAETQAYISEIQGCSYSGANLNIDLIFQRINSFYLSFQRSGAGRCFFLMGGFSVGSDLEIQTKIALYMQTISINFRFYYFAIGSQTSLTFWRDLVDEAYIIQLGSFVGITSSWFQQNMNTFTVYGLRRNTKKVNLQLVLTLDGSGATGKDGYYKTLYMILTLLRTYTLGNGNLQLYVCVHRSNQVSVVRFTSESDLSSNLAILSTSVSYPSAPSNTIILLQKVQWVVETYFATTRPRTVWLCGGMAVSNQEQVNLILYQLQVRLKVYFYYYVMGVQTDTTYWRQALGNTFVKTDFGVTSTFVDRIITTVTQTVTNLSGPTVTSVISSVSGSSSGGSSSGGSSSGGSSSGGSSSGGSSSGGSSSGGSSSGGSSSGGSSSGGSSSGGSSSGGSSSGGSSSGGSSSGGSSSGGSSSGGSSSGGSSSGGSSSGGSSSGGSSSGGSSSGGSSSGGWSSGGSSSGGSSSGGSSSGGSSSGGSSSGGSSSGGSSSGGSSSGGSSSGGSSSGSIQRVNIKNGPNTLIINGHQITVQFIVHGGYLYVSKNINPEGSCPLGTMDASTQGWCQVTSLQSFQSWTLSFHLNLHFPESMLVGGSSGGSSSGGSSSGGSSSGGSSSGGSSSGGSGSSSGSSQTITIQSGGNTLIINGHQITVQFIVHGGYLFVSKNINPEGSCPLGTMDATTQGWCQVTSLESFQSWTLSFHLNLHFPESMIAVGTTGGSSVGGSSGGSSSGGSSSGGSSSGGSSSGGSSSGGSSSGGSSSGGSSSGSSQTITIQSGGNTLIINGHQITVQFIFNGGYLFVSKNINPEGSCPLGTMDASTQGWCQVTSIQSFQSWTLSFHLNLHFPESMLAGGTTGGSSVGGSSSGGSSSGGSSSGGSSSGGSSSGGSSSGGSSSGGSDSSSGSSQTITIHSGGNTLIINGHQITVQFIVHGGYLYVSKNINPEGSCPLGTMDASTQGWCQVTSLQSFQSWTLSFHLNLHFPESMLVGGSSGGSSSGGSSSGGSSSGGSSSGGSSSGGSSSGGSSSGGSSSGSSQTTTIQSGGNTLIINGHQITVQFAVSGGKLYVSKNINPDGSCPLGTMGVSTQGWCQVISFQSFKTWTLSLHLNLHFSESLIQVFGGGTSVGGSSGGSSSGGSSSGGSSSGGSSSGGSSSGSTQTVNIQNGMNTVIINGQHITVQFTVQGGFLFVSKNINPEGSCPLGTMDAATQGWCQVTNIQNFKSWTLSVHLNINFGSNIMEMYQSSSSTGTEHTVLSARIVGGVTQVPAAMNIQGSGCMAGTSDVGGGYCAINNMDAFISWARSAGFNVERTEQNGIHTIRISGTVSYTG
ncbi:autotransporter CRAC-like isoform X3 [Lineus longissimus]|uniref:autotransporter CRAC-like isoform X3 n=1 Tax=Lineus longissimus TaxID=88925 RepID=UPI00315D81CE